MVAASAAAAAVGGCGSDTTAQYRSAAQIAGQDFRDAAGPALDQLRSAPSAFAKAAAVDRFKEAVDRASKRFGQLHPPDQARADNTALTGQFRRLSADLVRYRAALGAGDVAATRISAAGVEQDFARLEQASARLNHEVGA